MKLQQLMNVTPHGTTRAAGRLQVVGFQSTSEAPLTRYMASFIGASRKLRKSQMVLNDNGDVQVKCSCEFFESVLLLALAAHKAVVEGTSIDRKNKMVGNKASKPKLCAHLLRLAYIVSSPTALKRMQKIAAKHDEPTKTTKVSSRLMSI